MPKRRTNEKSPRKPAEANPPVSGRLTAGRLPTRLLARSEGWETGIWVTGETPQKRWREIGRGMAGDAGWQRGVQTFALILHTAAEQNEPEEMQAFADSFTGLFFSWVTDEANRLGLALTEEQADDIGSAFFSAALDISERLPFSDTGATS